MGEMSMAACWGVVSLLLFDRYIFLGLDFVGGGVGASGSGEDKMCI